MYLTRTSRDKNSIKRITSKKKKKWSKSFFWSKSTTSLKPKLHMNIIVHILNHGNVKPSFQVSNLVRSSIDLIHDIISQPTSF